MKEIDPLIAYDDDLDTDEIHQPYTAYNQGWDAGTDGVPWSLNPYPEGTRENQWWSAGWEEGAY